MKPDEDRLVPIFINHKKYEVTEGPMTGRKILEVAGYDLNYDLFLLQGEGDPSGGRPIQPDETIEIKPGMHFRVITKNPNFGGRL